MSTIKQIIDRDWDSISQLMFEDAELGVDEDDEGHSSECIDNLESIVCSAAEIAVESYVEENNADITIEEQAKLYSQAHDLIESRVDVAGLLNEIKDANQAYNDQWSDYYAMTCGGIR